MTLTMVVLILPESIYPLDPLLRPDDIQESQRVQASGHQQNHPNTAAAIPEELEDGLLVDRNQNPAEASAESTEPAIDPALETLDSNLSAAQGNASVTAPAENQPIVGGSNQVLTAQVNEDNNSQADLAQNSETHILSDAQVQNTSTAPPDNISSATTANQNSSAPSAGTYRNYHAMDNDDLRTVQATIFTQVPGTSHMFAGVTPNPIGVCNQPRGPNRILVSTQILIVNATDGVFFGGNANLPNVGSDKVVERAVRLNFLCKLGKVLAELAGVSSGGNHTDDQQWDATCQLLDGYELFERPRKTPRDDRAGDLYVIGHPRGGANFFRSVVEFAKHVHWLGRGNPAVGCSCPLCGRDAAALGAGPSLALQAGRVRVLPMMVARSGGQAGAQFLNQGAQEGEGAEEDEDEEMADGDGAEELEEE